MWHIFTKPLFLLPSEVRFHKNLIFSRQAEMYFLKIHIPLPKTAFSAFSSFPLSFQERGGGGAAPRASPAPAFLFYTLFSY